MKRSRPRATEALLGDEQHEAFMRALDDPPPPSARLRKLFADDATGSRQTYERCSP
jgi:uncharacterized protein (DUF1778 family)